MIKRLLLVAVTSLAATTAQAHVVIFPASADPGAYFLGSFRVGHGCGENTTTTAIRVEIPAGVEQARPRPVPGWKLAIEREAGKVVAITWRGAVPDEQFQAFDIQMKLPATPGPLYFPVIQTCGKLSSKWIEVPAPGEASARPAPRLDIGTAPAAAPAHNH